MVTSDFELHTNGNTHMLRVTAATMSTQQTIFLDGKQYLSHRAVYVNNHVLYALCIDDIPVDIMIRNQFGIPVIHVFVNGADLAEELLPLSEYKANLVAKTDMSLRSYCKEKFFVPLLRWFSWFAACLVLYGIASDYSRHQYLVAGVYFLLLTLLCVFLELFFTHRSGQRMGENMTHCYQDKNHGGNQ